VERNLGLLDDLKGVVRDFAAREHRLQQEAGTHALADKRQYEAALGELTARLSTQIGQADTGFETAKASLQAQFQQRQTRLGRAHKTSRKQRLDEVENYSGRGTYMLQKETMQAERTRDADLAGAQAACADYQGRVVEQREVLADLEERTGQFFAGYRSFARLLTEPRETAPPALPTDLSALFDALVGALRQANDGLEAFRKLPIARFFQYFPVSVCLVLAALVDAALIPALPYFGVQGFSYTHAAGALVAVVVLVRLLHGYGRRQAGALASRIAEAIWQARRLHDACLEHSEAQLKAGLERIKSDFRTLTQRLDAQWKGVTTEATSLRISWGTNVDEKYRHLLARAHEIQRRRLAQLEASHGETRQRLEQELAAQTRKMADLRQERTAKFQAEHQARWASLAEEWQGRVGPLWQVLQEAARLAETTFPQWSAEYCAQWVPPGQFAAAAQFARLEVEFAQFCETLPKDPRLAFPGPAQFPVPLVLMYPQQGSLLFETTSAGRDESIGALNNLILRLLTNAPPGRLSFTIIDPVGLGQNFAGVMHLSDYGEHLIQSRIWTQSGQIEQRLADLNEHMEKVIQMYLRNVYETIAQYNEQAGNIAEKYHFVVVADFPVNFSDVAARRLLKIAASGARCGVHTLIHWDRRHALPAEFVAEELRKSSVCVTAKGHELTLASLAAPGLQLQLDPPPPADLAIELIQRIGRSSKDANRVEVPFAHVAPPAGEVWTQETAGELRVPIGRTGATKLQYLAIGKGTRQHALLAGKTGSGKSTLFHVIVTNLALWCSPEEVEFYLVDFKKGVEFKCYAAKRLPHARVVAIESDREFGLSVLQRLDDELKRRGDLFRQLGVQDVAGYKKAGGTEPVPRSLLIIDEFQEFFVEDDRIAQGASVLLDRIVRQGRAFGIHVLLGSQTLGGAYTLARTTLGQMVIRIALQCNEADALLIMDENNPAPRLLSRPGEGIYNDSAGALEGNSPFQAVWISDDERDECLDNVRALADRSAKTYPGPIVFEGNAPADVRENVALRTLLEAPAVQPTAAARFWLGAPNSIKGPTEVIFHRQSGNHLLLVGQRDEATLAILSVALVALGAQYPLGAARFVVLDGNPPDSTPGLYLQSVLRDIPHPVRLAKGGELAEIFKGLAADLQQRTDDELAAAGPPVFLFVHGLQKFSKLRQEEEFSFSSGDSDAGPSPAVQFSKLVSEGARLGLHIIATLDTYNNVTRYLGRKALTEFEMRVLFQMGANDSASLIDNPKASTLGLHRAVFYNEQEGQLETFRPYALPDRAWLDEAGGQLARLLK
jgi:hypothetical protein